MGPLNVRALRAVLVMVLGTVLIPAPPEADPESDLSVIRSSPAGDAGRPCSAPGWLHWPGDHAAAAGKDDVP